MGPALNTFWEGGPTPGWSPGGAWPGCCLSGQWFCLPEAGEVAGPDGAAPQGRQLGHLLGFLPRQSPIPPAQLAFLLSVQMGGCPGAVPLPCWEPWAQAGGAPSPTLGELDARPRVITGPSFPALGMPFPAPPAPALCCWAPPPAPLHLLPPRGRPGCHPVPSPPSWGQCHLQSRQWGAQA